MPKLEQLKPDTADFHHVGEHRCIPDTKLGRALCRAGLHKWAFIEGTEPIEGGYYWRKIMSYCERPACLEPIRVIDTDVFPKAYLDLNDRIDRAGT